MKKLPLTLAKSPLAFSPESPYIPFSATDAAKVTIVSKTRIPPRKSPKMRASSQLYSISQRGFSNFSEPEKT